MKTSQKTGLIPKANERIAPQGRPSQGWYSRAGRAAYPTPGQHPGPNPGLGSFTGPVQVQGTGTYPGAAEGQSVGVLAGSVPSPSAVSGMYTGEAPGATGYAGPALGEDSSDYEIGTGRGQGLGKPGSYTPAPNYHIHIHIHTER